MLLSLRFRRVCIVLIATFLVPNDEDTFGADEGVHRPKITAIAWGRVATANTVVTPAILNDHEQVLTVQIPQYGGATLNVWQLGNAERAASRLHQVIQVPDQVLPLLNGTQVLFRTQHVNLWNIDERRIQVVGAILPKQVDGIRLVPGGSCDDVTANDSSRLIAMTVDLEKILLARYETPAVAVASDAAAHTIRMNATGDRLIAIGADAVHIHPIDPERLTLEPPSLTFHQLLGSATNEVANGLSALSIPETKLPARGAIPSFGLAVTFDDTNCFVRFPVMPPEVSWWDFRASPLGFETWVITQNDQCRMVRFDERSLSAPWDEIAWLGTRSITGKHPWPHFLIVCTEGLVAVPTASDEFRSGVPDNCFVRFPETVNGHGDIDAAIAADINSTGTQIVTAHRNGSVILWSYEF
jgi:hypothetical protein